MKVPLTVSTGEIACTAMLQASHWAFCNGGLVLGHGVGCTDWEEEVLVLSPCRMPGDSST